MLKNMKFAILSFMALAIIGNTICSEEASDEQMGRELIQAAESGDAQRVNAIVLLRRHLINYQISRMTPLIAAAQQGHKRVVEALLRHGAPVDQDFYGETALTKAAFYGKTEIVRILLQHGANIEQRNILGRTALNSAAYSGHFDTCIALLQHGANIETNDDNDETPLHAAATEGHVNIVRLLLEHGARLDTRESLCGLTPLETLFKDYPWIESMPTEKKLAIIKLLISYGAEVTDEFAQKIHSEFPHYDWRAERPAGNASRSRQLASQIHLWIRSQTLPIHTAAQSGDLATIRTELQNGADIDAQDGLGNTPLHLAATHGHGDAVSTLLQHDATIDALNHFGQTPLYCVAADTKDTYRNAKREQLNMFVFFIYNDAEVTEEIEQAIKESMRSLFPRFDWRIEKLVCQEQIKGTFDNILEQWIIDTPPGSNLKDASAQECIKRAINELFGLPLVEGEAQAQSATDVETEAEGEGENNNESESDNSDLQCCICLNTARELAANPLWAICYQSQKHRVCTECFRGMQRARRAHNCPLCRQPIIRW